MFKSLCLLIIFSCVYSKPDLNHETFEKDALMAHNLYRQIHGAQPLKLNSDLSKLAFERAKELASIQHLNIKQNFYNGINLGETVGSISGFGEYNGISATQFWYSTISEYDKEGEASNNGGSFTQIVWKSTKEVGFGIVRGNDSTFYFVAEYLPSGNIRGQYDVNVNQLTDNLMQSGSINPLISSTNQVNNETVSVSTSSNDLKSEIIINSTKSILQEPLNNTSLITTKTLSHHHHHTFKEITTTKSNIRFTSYANKIWIPKNAGNIDLDSIRLMKPIVKESAGNTNDYEINQKYGNNNSETDIAFQPASLIFRLTTQNRPKDSLANSTLAEKSSVVDQMNATNESILFNNSSFNDFQSVESSINLTTQTSMTSTETTTTTKTSAFKTKSYRKFKKVKTNKPNHQKKSIETTSQYKAQKNSDDEKEDDNIDFELMTNEPDRMKLRGYF